MQRRKGSLKMSIEMQLKKKYGGKVMLYILNHLPPTHALFNKDNDLCNVMVPDSLIEEAREKTKNQRSLYID